MYKAACVLDLERCREQYILLLFSSNTWKNGKRDDPMVMEGNHTLKPTNETLMLLKRRGGHFISFFHIPYLPFHSLWKPFSFMYIICVKAMIQLYASYSRNRAVFSAWTPKLPALMLIKPGLMLRVSDVSASGWIHAIYLYAWSFACCIFLVVLILLFIYLFSFIFSSFYHKRWTRMNVWLFLLKTLLPWEITEAIAEPAFTDAVSAPVVPNMVWIEYIEFMLLEAGKSCIVHLYSRRLGTDKQAVTSRQSQGFTIHGNSWCPLLKGKKAFNFPCPVPHRKKALQVWKSFPLKEHLKPSLFHEV